MFNTGVRTEVIVGADVKFGVFANAFRVVEDAEDERLLDFLVYSPAENIATVVSRVRVHAGLLPAIREQLGEAMKELPEESSEAYRKTKGNLH